MAEVIRPARPGRGRGELEARAEPVAARLPAEVAAAVAALRDQLARLEEMDRRSDGPAGPGGGTGKGRRGGGDTG